jgi:hypothetical protein
MFQFFSQTEAKKPLPLSPNCRECGLRDHCKHPVQVSASRKGTTVFLVNGPGKDDPDGIRIQKRLAAYMQDIGENLGDYRIIAATACSPGIPMEKKKQYWKHCQPLMVQQIKEANPEKIVVFGKHALASIIDWLWHDPAGLPDRWLGRKIPSRELNAWICPVGLKGVLKNPKVAQIYLYRGLRDAMRLKGRPYDKVSVDDYANRVEVASDLSRIEHLLDEASRSPLSAFDYETNCLKCEKPKAKIFTASVAWLSASGPKCVAFPMADRLADPWKRYVTSDSKKIAANLKFEHRWTKQHFDVDVNKWLWDNVIVGHMYDPMEGVAGLKFQSFCHLGLPYFASEVEKYFDNSDENGYNSIHLANQKNLLVYNGIDSLVELDLGILQMYQSPIKCDWWTDTMPRQSYYTKGEWF